MQIGAATVESSMELPKKIMTQQFHFWEYIQRKPKH